MDDLRYLEDDDWPEEYAVDFEELRSATSEMPFLKVSFELLKEAAGLTIMATGISPEPSPTRARNQAIYIGHLVRMVKMMRTTIRSIVDDHGGDQQMQLARQFLDSASALAYFLEDVGDTSRLDAYVNDSLIAEREFLADVHRQITERGGQKLPIEDRIEQSIRTTFQLAGVEPEDLPSRSKNNWPSAQERLKLLGPTAYSAYRMGSGSIHGSWHDLERNHLELVNGAFQPYHEAAPTRPQPLFAMSLLAASIVRDFIRKLLPAAQPLFEPRIVGFLERLRQADELHEAFVTNRAGQGQDPE
jgi:Family of unknown function (DUF5677)